MGFQAECQGLIDRYIRVEGAWDDHLERTRKFISGVVAGKKINNLAILGSGWLLDVPLKELAEVSGHVWLYDVIHPAQIIHKLQKYPNVTTVKTDITGGCIMNAWKAVKQYHMNGVKTAPEEICNGAFQPDPVPDYIISLNLLSQIGEMITGYLQKYISYTPEEIIRINCLLQQAHLNMLPSGRTGLVTDIRETDTDLSGEKEVILDLLCAVLPETGRKQTWEWNFDPDGHYKSGQKTVLQVVALEL